MEVSERLCPPQRKMNEKYYSRRYFVLVFIKRAKKSEMRVEIWGSFGRGVRFNDRRRGNESLPGNETLPGDGREAGLYDKSEQVPWLLVFAGYAVGLSGQDADANALVFTYTVQEGHETAALEVESASALRGTVRLDAT